MKRYMMVGAALAAASLGPLPVMAQKTAVPAPSLLTVLEANAKPGNAVYEAGSRGPQTAAGPLEHIFVLRNTTGTALTLDHLQASCACTTATVVGGTSADGPTVLAPNGTLSVRVSVDLQRLLPGLLHKSVWVFVQGQAAPAATLEMTGALLPLVSFAPPSLSFGRIEKGTELTLLLRATTPPERLEQGTELRLVSLDPDMQVSEVAPDVLRPPVVHSYRVRLVPYHHVGRLEGHLSLVLAGRGDTAETQGPVVATAAWRAEAEGTVSASPAVIGFGVTTGQTVTRKIMLTGKGWGSDPKAWVFSSTSPYLTASLKSLPSPNGRATTKAAEPQIEMDVRLDPHTPVGPLDARVMVTPPRGEQLVLPPSQSYSLFRRPADNFSHAILFHLLRFPLHLLRFPSASSQVQ